MIYSDGAIITVKSHAIGERSKSMHEPPKFDGGTRFDKSTLWEYFGDMGRATAETPLSGTCNSTIPPSERQP